MSVQRMRPAATGKPPVKRKIVAKRETLSLPDEPINLEPDFYKYVTLIHGRPGIGKTTLVMSFPDVLLAACERLSRAIPGYVFNYDNGGIRDWDDFLDMISLLEQTDRFRTIGIDTVTALYQMCFQWVCKKNGVAHPSDDDWGKSWTDIKAEFTAQMDRLIKTGRGVVLTAHSSEREIKSFSGEKYSRIHPEMSGGLLQWIKAKTDFVFYAEYVQDADGKTQRVLFTKGNELVDAKSASLTGEFPMFVPMLKKGGAEYLAKVFKGEAGGLDPATLKPAKTVTKTGMATLNMAKASIARQRLGAVKRPLQSKR